VDFGDWSGYNWEEVRDKYGVHPYDWLDKIELGQVPGGESRAQLRARVEPCLSDIILQHKGGSVAIFCHGGVIRMMLSILLELPLPKTNSFEIEYASITQVSLMPHLNEIELLNFTPWRDI
jgi:broad specificity phosphatase PhoE